MNVNELVKSEFASVFQLNRVENVKINKLTFTDNRNVKPGKYYKVDPYEVSYPVMYGDDSTVVDRVLYIELCKCAASWNKLPSFKLEDILPHAIETGFSFDNTVLVESDTVHLTVFCPERLQLTLPDELHTDIVTHPWEFLLVVIGNKKVGRIVHNDSMYGVCVYPWSKEQSNKSCYIYGYYEWW